MNQGRIVGISLIISVTLYAAGIYIRDIFVFDHGVQTVKACERMIAIGDSAPVMERKFANSPCSELRTGREDGDDGLWFAYARSTNAHDSWAVFAETRGGVVTAVRYGSMDRPTKRPEGAPPERR